jgi:hypothetical protein
VNALVSEPMGKAVCASASLGLADRAHAIAFGDDDLAVLDDGERHARRRRMSSSIARRIRVEVGRRRAAAAPAEREHDSDQKRTTNM